MVLKQKHSYKTTSKFASLVITFLFICSLTIAPKANAAILQDGWYKIVSGGQHVGFIVLRYEFDESKKQFTSTSYTQTNALAGGLKESLISVAAQDLAPISYQYTSQIGQIAKTIDAAFAKGVMTAKVTEAGKNESIQNKLNKGTFLSQFLVYLILQNPKGMKVGNKYVYSAIAEEDGKVHDGEAYISAMETVNGIETYKILNNFKGAKYISYVTPKGIVLLTKDPVQSLSTELVANPEVATKGFDFNRKTLTLLFKTLPTGATVAKAPSEPSTANTASGESSNASPAATNQINEEKMKKLEEEPKSETPKGMLIPPGKGQ